MIVSVNAQPDSEPSKEDRDQYQEETGKDFDLGDYRLRIVRGLIGDNLPAGTSSANLRGQELGKVFRQVINNEITEQLSVRNAMLPEQDKVYYQQLFHFRYKDGARMLTVGGVFYKAGDMKIVESCAFDTLPFVKNGSDHCEIRVPCLTGKEIRHLNSQLPTKSTAKLRVPGVPVSDIKQYAEVYRFFPTFSEILYA